MSDTPYCRCGHPRTRHVNGGTAFCTGGWDKGEPACNCQKYVKDKPRVPVRRV